MAEVKPLWEDLKSSRKKNKEMEMMMEIKSRRKRLSKWEEVFEYFDLC